LAALDAGLLGGGVAAALVGIYADLAYNAYSATNSSPQTTELFASERSDTLWKYVRLGGLQVVAFGMFGSLLARSVWPLIGVVIVGVLMSVLYAHALRAGGAGESRLLAS